MNLTDTAPTIEQSIALKQQRAISEHALQSIFTEARTANGFLPNPIPRELIERIVEVTELGPTSANGLPVRFVFVESAQGKEKLRPALAPGNLDKTMAAPMTAIVAADLKFYEQFARTFPTRAQMAEMFAGEANAGKAREYARDNALIQLGYFTIAIRAFGLDCGAMAGFDRTIVDDAFFPDGNWISLYLMNIGYNDDKLSFPRLPRLEPAEIARLA